MPKSKDDLRQAIKDARHSKNAADKALKKLTDIHVPSSAHKARRGLVERLRAIVHRAEARIPVLRRRLQALQTSGAEKAVKEAKSLIGTREDPVGSNWGGRVTDFITYTGYSSPVYWCGCFACWCVVRAGGAKVPTRIRFGYGPYLIDDARAGANGLHAVPFADAQPGDVLVYWGGDHIGLAVSKPNGSSIQTVEGNTGDGNAVNGDGVYARTRSSSDVTAVCRPTYV